MASFTNRLVVSLAAGASTTVAHGVTVDGAAATPHVVQPDRSTPIVVSALTATSVTFTNPSASAQDANFMCEFLFSTQSRPADVPAGSMIWQGQAATSSGAVGGTSRTFYINTAIVDSAAYAAQGVFSDIGPAMTWAEANVPAGLGLCFELAPTDQTGPWPTLTNTGWAVGSTREIIIKGSGGDYAGSLMFISAACVLPAANVISPTFVFQDLYVVQNADLTLGTNRQILIKNCFWGADETSLIICDVYAATIKNSTLFFAQFTAAQAMDLNIDGGLTRIRKSQILLDGIGNLSFTNAALNINAVAAGNTPKLIRTPSGFSQVTFTNTGMFLYQSVTAVACTLLDFAAASLVTFDGLTISSSLDGAATMAMTNAFGAINSVPGPYGLQVYRNNGAGAFQYALGTPINTYAFQPGPPVTTANAVAPAFATPVQVSPLLNERVVTATIRTVAAGGGAAGVALEVETAYLSGVYEEVASVQIGAGVVRTDYNTITYPVKGGLRYQFVDLSAGGASATIAAATGAPSTGYGYTDR